MSCTESLGFESSDEISSLDDLGTCNYHNSSNMIRKQEKWPLNMSEEKKFPPPLSSLSENGRRSFILRPVRSDGRLEIVGLMIERPEILCASRQNGRLRLRLVRTVFDDEDSEGDIEEERENEEGETEEDEREWKIPAVAALRRCCNRRDMLVWSQQQHRYVTTM